MNFVRTWGRLRAALFASTVIVWLPVGLGIAIAGDSALPGRREMFVGGALVAWPILAAVLFHKFKDD